MNTKGLHVLVTGAGRGLGLSLTRLLLEKNHKVFAISLTLSDELMELKKSHAENLILFAADVAREEKIKEAVGHLTQSWDSLDIIINNASVHLETAKNDIEELDFNIYPQTFAINSIAPLSVIKHFLPLLRKGEGKLAVSISSEAGSIADCQRTSEYSYCMSKSALNMGMKILQNRLKAERIKILLIHPGWVRTDMGGSNATLSPKESAEAVYAQILKEHRIEGPMYIDWTGKELPW